MIRYLLIRMAHALIVVWAAYTLAFAVLWVLPGDPVAIMLSQVDGGQGDLPAAQVAALRGSLGLDQPLPVQYAEHLRAAVTGDFGTSVTTGEPVLRMITRPLPATLALTGGALLLGMLAGTAVAVAANLTGRRRLSRLLDALPPVGMSVPTFLVGLVLVHVVAFQWRWFPGIGNGGPRGLVLPSVTLAIPVAATVAQVLGRSLSATLAEPYVNTLRAKGASELRIVMRHAMRNAAPPTLTVAGLLLGSLVAGSVVVERVFSRVGLGRTIATAIQDKDIPVVLAVTVLSATGFALVNLLLDLMYPLIDPRIGTRAGVRGSGGRRGSRIEVPDGL
jgi:peptide/nickel transport system permease protein